MSATGFSTNAVPNGVLAAASTVGSATMNASGSTKGQVITATDFMKLLVTEMKNQDPTQPTDPNAYIQQLVGVNSLQQLISINGELGSTATKSTSAVIGA